MSPECGTVGWDLGGAHLKAAAIDAGGRLLWVRQRPVPLWQGLQHLDAGLRDIAAGDELSGFAHALTMTGELVDLFADRAQGVVALTDRFGARVPGGALSLYAGPRGFVGAAQARESAAAIASANWHATAAWLATVRPYGMLVDIGSTTTDILPFTDGELRNRGYTDRERLAADELVYSGIVRTPVMAVVRHVPFAGEWQSLANEHFATMADVYRILDLLPDNADQHPSADGRGKDVHSSMRRLARMVGADRQDADSAQWRRLAAFIADRQLDAIATACWRRLSGLAAAPVPLIAAGVGRHLVERLAQRLHSEVVDIDLLLGSPAGGDTAAGTCAPAVAVARLAQRRQQGCAG